MHWDFALIFIVLGGAVPLLGLRRIRQLLKSEATTKSDRLRLYASTAAFQWIAAGFVFWRAKIHGIGPAQLGLTISNPALVLTVSLGFAALVFANQFFSLRKLAQYPDQTAGGILRHLALRIFPQDTAERFAFFGLVVTVALCEEFIFRGFVQWFFQNPSRDSALIGIVGSSLLFAWAHLYQGRRGLLSTFIAGIVFASVRFWTGSLVPSSLAHFVADFTAGLMAPSVFARKHPSADEKLAPSTSQL